MGSSRPLIFRQLARVLSLAALLTASAAAAQEAPPYIAVVDGSASLERDGLLEEAIAGIPILEGDRLSTSAGRVEVIFADGSALDIDEYSSIDFGPPPQFRVAGGRAMLSSARADRQPASARPDDFQWWVQARRDERFGPNVSGQYLPSGLRSYGTTFDREGIWQYEAPYGYVWYPSVGSDWRPYYNGYWSSVRPYGMTWIGLDRWAWPTHHYGRWGYSHSRWFWIPGQSWGPAWVTWASAPGYVSWCPLGFNNRPVFSLSVNVNVGSPHGWVTIDREHFGARRTPVNRYAFENRRPPAGLQPVPTARGPLGATPVPRPGRPMPSTPNPNRQPPAAVQRPSPQPEVAMPRPIRERPSVAAEQPPPQVRKAVPNWDGGAPAAVQAPAVQAEQPPPVRKAVPSGDGGRPAAVQAPAVQAERPPERAKEPIRARPAPQDDGGGARRGESGNARSGAQGGQKARAR